MVWYPPSMWEAHGVPWGAYAGYVPGADVLMERYCAACACSQKATDEVPCWNCGGETQPNRPRFWPVCGSPQMVIGGNSFDVRELEETDASS